jgi:hypothetical protein
MLSMFPQGFSHHGWAYLSIQTTLLEIRHNTGANAWVHHDFAVELLFEYIRKAHFPHMPSRFQSYFACDSLADVARYSQNGAHPVFELSSQTPPPKLDDQWLRFGQFNMTVVLARADYNAHQYWSGAQCSPTSQWEYLMVPPVSVAGPVP